MNRTQRKVKKSYREQEDELKRRKNREIERRKHHLGSAFHPMEVICETVNLLSKEEKECKVVTRDYKCRAKSEKKEKAIS